MRAFWADWQVAEITMSATNLSIALPGAHKLRFAPWQGGWWRRSGVVCPFRLEASRLLPCLPRSRTRPFLPAGTQVAICAIFSRRWFKSRLVCLFHFATACLRMRLPRSRESAFQLRDAQVAICAIFLQRWFKSRLVCLWALLRSCARRSQLVFATFLGGNPELCVNEALEDATPDVGRIKALYYSFV